jgi:hypothetical protein
MVNRVREAGWLGGSQVAEITRKFGGGLTSPLECATLKTSGRSPGNKPYASRRKAHGGKSMAKLVPFEEFVKKAIVALRDEDKSKGIHAVYSGFASAARKYYGRKKHDDPNQDWLWLGISALADKGRIEVTRAKGGSMLYLVGDAPKRGERQTDKVISTILG